MIEFRKCPVVDGVAYPTVKLARVAILSHLMKNEPLTIGGTTDETLSTWIVEHGDMIVDVLTTDESSRPKARAIHGGRKPRKAKSEAETPAEPKSA